MIGGLARLGLLHDVMIRVVAAPDESRDRVVSGLSVCRSFQCADIQFLHLQHGLHRAVCARLSGSVSSSPSRFGTICHEKPNLSFNHPHMLSLPPSAVNAVQ